MTREGANDFVRAIAWRVVAITVACMLVLVPRLASANAVDSLIKQLEASSDKVRLSAALNLTKLGDGKAVLPMAKALSNDDDKNVRSAAAVGLAKLVPRASNKSVRNLAIKALKKAAADDSSEFVQAQAAKSLKALGVSEDGGTSGPSRGGSIYVNIGPMSSKTGNSSLDPKMRATMVKVATGTMARAASSMTTTWAGGKAPTKGQLTAKGFQGFYVDGTVNEVKVTTSGASATVSCKINMLLASYPDKSVFGFLNGGAKVQGSSSSRDIDLATEDCVAAVVEDLIAKKIVPTIKIKANP